MCGSVARSRLGLALEARAHVLVVASRVQDLTAKRLAMRTVRGPIHLAHAPAAIRSSTRYRRPEPRQERSPDSRPVFVPCAGTSEREVGRLAPRAVAHGRELASYGRPALGRKRGHELVELGSWRATRHADGGRAVPMETTYTWEPVGESRTRMTLRNRGEPSGFLQDAPRSWGARCVERIERTHTPEGLLERA